MQRFFFFLLISILLSVEKKIFPTMALEHLVVYMIEKNKRLKQNSRSNWAWWHMPVILALGRPRQEEC